MTSGYSPVWRSASVRSAHTLDELDHIRGKNVDESRSGSDVDGNTVGVYVGVDWDKEKTVVV